MDPSAWNLVCPACRKRYPVDVPRTACCGDFPLDLPSPALDLSAWPPQSRRIARYADLLPLPEGHFPIDLGERVTPLVKDPAGSGNILFKMEGLLPTGSFKDRGYHVLVNRLAAWRVPAVTGDSSGNAAVSLAAYCARAGIRAILHVPVSASPGKLDLIRRLGAEIRQAPTRAEARVEALREAESSFYAGHTGNPFFLHGVKTLAYEIYDQLGGGNPGTIVMPVGNGTLLLGLALGFRELYRAGRIHRLPRLVGVQAKACGPLAIAYRSGSPVPAAIPPAPTAAEGIAIPEPPRGKEILRTVRDCGGEILAVGEKEIDSAHRDLARRGFLVEPTSATAAAALRHLKNFGEGKDPVVVILTGSGLKTLMKKPGT